MPERVCFVESISFSSSQYRLYQRRSSPANRASGRAGERHLCQPPIGQRVPARIFFPSPAVCKGRTRSRAAALHIACPLPWGALTALVLSLPPLPGIETAEGGLRWPLFTPVALYAPRCASAGVCGVCPTRPVSYFFPPSRPLSPPCSKNLPTLM